jgi:YHS domain-containing protein
MKYLFASLLCILSMSAFGQAENANRRRNFNTENDVAMREFDPISYFQGKPARGTSKFEYNHKGIYYYFVNEANREEFKKSPGKFEPAYGGFCAYTVALNGERVKILPNTYKIIDGKLYLFYNFNGDDRLAKWNAGNEKALRASGNKNWYAKMH